MRKTLALMLALVMALSLVTVVAEAEPFAITIMLPSFYEETFQAVDNPVVMAIEKLTDTKLTIPSVPNATYPDVTSVTLADPGNMPMIMVLQDPLGSVTVSSARAGAFWDITEYIKDYEYLVQGSDVVYNNIKIDGRLYGIYRARPLARNGIIYRKDWAEELGLGVPETLDDLKTLAKAFTNAEKGTYGLQMCKYVDGTIKIVTIMHGAPNLWGVNENGDVYPAHTDPAYREGLKWLRELYEYGAINQDFMVLESGVWDDAIKQSKAGLKLDVMDGGYRLQEYFETNKLADKTIFDLLPYVKNVEGEIRMWPTSGFNGEVVITKAVKTEEDMKKCLSFLNLLNSAAGQTLTGYGVQDVTYWVDEEGHILVAAKDKEVYVKTVQSSLNQIGMNVVTLSDVPTAKLSELRALYNKNLVDGLPYVIGNPCAAFVSETYSLVGTTLNLLLEDAHVQFIAGQISEEELEAVYQQWSDDGGAKIIDEMNTIYHSTSK